MLYSDRFVFYSHDGKSYGHITKLARISNSLIEIYPQYSVYCISSSPFAFNFLTPFAHIDYLKLPSYYYSIDYENDTTKSKFFLNIKKNDFYKIRYELIKSLIFSFCPKTLFLECNPIGKNGEMMTFVEYIKNKSGKVIWGINGYLSNDDYKLFQQPEILSFIDKNIDRLLVYNQPDVIDIFMEYPELRILKNRTSYVGYLCPTYIHNESTQIENFVLVQLGGGGIAQRLLEKLIEIGKNLKSLNFKIYTGYYIQNTTFQSIKYEIKDFSNIELCKHTNNISDELKKCKLFIGAGGYNTW